MRKLFSSMTLNAAFAVSLTGHLAYASNGCAIAGPANAPVTIEEFADFHCKFCMRGTNTMKEVVKNYPNKVKLVFRNLPLPFHNPGALTAAKAFSAVCLQSPSLAYSYQTELFDNQDKLIKDGDQFLFDVADKLGVNVTQMKTDMESDAVAKMISEDQHAADLHNFKGTPSFLIGSEEVIGARPYDEIRQIIDRQLGTN